MKKLTCEMCGSSDMLKEDGVFICQSCGMKYSVEEAKKMMIEGTVEVEGTVKIDSSSEIDNLYQAARNAKENADYVTAIKHYEAINARVPNDWESMFYLVILRATAIKNAEIGITATKITNCLPKVFDCIKLLPDKEAQKTAVKEVADQSYAVAILLLNGSVSFYKSLSLTLATALGDHRDRCLEIANILLTCGDCIVSKFDANDEDYKQTALLLWKIVPATTSNIAKEDAFLLLKSQLEPFSTRIKKYDPSYQTPKSGGCYVATAVYGSYDCPEVWTLRRYRDNTLAENWYGRVFIKAYYAVSPTLVKWFGNTAWFKKMWQGTLDRMVTDLHSKGFESTPYEDKEW